MQVEISGSFRALQKSPAFGQAPNRMYIDLIKANVIAECSADLGELMDIVLSGKLEMNDAERLSRLAKVHGSMKEKAMFTRWFCAEVQGLLQGRETEKLDLEGLRRLYENE